MAAAACALAAVPAAHAQVFEPRIIGGDTTTINQYPWQAAVAYDPAKASGNPFQRQFCGGSLITPYIVLTAAHCVYDTDPQNNSSLDPDDVNVILGQTTLSTAPPSSEYDVQGVAFQADYDDRYGPGQGVPSNDVGYLVLSSPYNATTPINIAGTDEGGLWDPGSLEQITGWGATATSGPGSGGSDTLRHATVPIVSDLSCTGSYDVYFNSSSMVCAGYPEGGVDTCYGDSGGPMQAALGGGEYRLVGITSWGSGCAQPDAPGVYTQVAGDALRPAVASTVFDLETSFGLPHEDITGGADDDPPETSITSGPSGPTNVATPVFTFTSDEPGSFECRVDTQPFAACTSPHTTASLNEGAHTFEVQAIDQANNTDPSPATRGFTVDTAAPTDPSVSSSSHTTGVLSNDPTVDVVGFGSASDSLSGVDGFSYLWDSSPATVPDQVKEAEESATGTTSPALADGSSHFFHLRTRDNAGNWTSTVHLGPFVIDAIVPAPPQITDTDPDSPSNLNDLKVKGIAEAGSTVLLYRAATSSDCTPANMIDTDTAATFSGAGLDASVPGDAVTRFRATVTDAAGNVSACSAGLDYVEDSTAPSDPALSSSSHSVGVASADTTVDLSFTGAADSLSGLDGFSYLWDTSAGTVPDQVKEAEETSTGTTSPALADGSSHFFHLRTRDNAGNWTSTAHLGPFVIDSSLPQPSTPRTDPLPDLTAPRGRLAANPKLSLRGEVILELGCDEHCVATASGLLVAKLKRGLAAAGGASRIPLASAGAEITAGGSVTVKLKPKGKKARRQATSLKRRGGRATATLTATFTDQAGNAASQNLVVKLKP